MTKYFTETTTKRPDLRATGEEAKTLPEDVIDKVLSVELFDDRHVAIPTRLNKETLNILSQYDISFYDLSEDTVVFCSDRKTLKDVALFCTVADEAVIGILLETQQAIRADLLQAIMITTSMMSRSAAVLAKRAICGCAGSKSERPDAHKIGRSYPSRPMSKFTPPRLRSS